MFSHTYPALHRQFLLVAAFLFPFFMSASNYYWVGGAGDWSDYANHWATTSGGLIFHVQEPTPFDDVYFDANSFSSSGQDVTVTATILTCNNMDWAGVTNAPVFSGNASTGQLEIYGSLTLDTGLVWSHYGLVHFRSTTTGKTIKVAGHTMNSIVFDGIGGSWALQDSLKVQALTLNAGTFYSNSNYIYVSNATLNSTASFGTSVIDFAYSWSASPFASIDADSTTIRNNLSGNFIGGNHAYHVLDFTGASLATIDGDNQFDRVSGPAGNFSISGNNIFDTLYCNNPGQIITLQSLTTQTIIDTLVVNGSCAGLTTLRSDATNWQATISKANGNVTSDYLLMENINATGGANFTANNSVIISNVTGWTIPIVPVQNLYWVGGTGFWSDPAHWSTTSGGAGGSCLPTLYDNVYFDANSFSTTGQDVEIDVATAYCVDMDWTGALYHPLFTSNNVLQLYGSLTLIDSMQIGYSNFVFRSNSPETITTGKHVLGSVTLDGNGGSWSLQDTLRLQTFYVSNGTFYSNSNYIQSFNTISVSDSAYFGASVIDFSTSWNMSPIAFVDADSTIISSTYQGTFNGGNHIYHNVNFHGNNATIDGNNQFDKVLDSTSFFSIIGNNNFDTLISTFAGQVFEIGYGNTQTINDTFSAGGSCAGLTTFRSSSPGMQGTISKATGNVTLNYLLMKDINATGGANFTATNSTIISNVTGWTVPTVPVQNLYWVGGTGQWSDPAHWSTTSGGTGGSCIPTLYDNVYFDANSFSSSGQDVDLNVNLAYCVDMDWTGAQFNPQLSGSGVVEIHGSLTLNDTMNTVSSVFVFESALPGTTIKTAGNHLGAVSIYGTGTFTLLDSLSVQTLNISAGTFYSNDQYIFAGNISVNDASYFGTSTIDFLFGWNAAPTAAIDVDSTVINNLYSGAFTGGNHVYHNLNFFGTSTATINDNNQFDKVVGPAGNFMISGNNVFDTLFFNNPGQTVTLGAGDIQTINLSLQANASGGFPISLVSDLPGVQSTISMPLGDTACLNYIYMQDQNATGGGIFYAGIYSSNITNNTGWQFSSCVQPISDVWPGDANYDLVTDNADILNIGIAFGQSAFVRPGASTTYVAQPCLDWPSQFITGVNTKHADTDGNGIVNLNDTLAVSLNYGLPHPPRLGAPDSLLATTPDLYFQFPGGPYVAGSWLDVDVDLGTLAIPAMNVYGIAFSVNYPASMIAPNTLSVHYNGSWLVASGNTIHLEKDFNANNKIDLGFSRINHTNVSGNGKIVTLHFKLANNASGPFMLSFSNITMVDKNGVLLQVNDLGSTVTVGIGEHPEFAAVSVYPNPTSGNLMIDLGGLQPAENSSVDLLDLAGRVILSVPAENQTIQLDLEDQSKGIYFIRVLLSDGSTLMKKVVKQ
jgi:hypothetical protein